MAFTFSISWSPGREQTATEATEGRVRRGLSIGGQGHRRPEAPWELTLGLPRGSGLRLGGDVWRFPAPLDCRNMSLLLLYRIHQDSEAGPPHRPEGQTAAHRTRSWRRGRPDSGCGLRWSRGARGARRLFHLPGLPPSHLLELLTGWAYSPISQAHPGRKHSGEQSRGVENGSGGGNWKLSSIQTPFAFMLLSSLCRWQQRLRISNLPKAIQCAS